MARWTFQVRTGYGTYYYDKVNVGLRTMQRSGACRFEVVDKFAGQSALLITWTGYIQVSDWAQGKC